MNAARSIVLIGMMGAGKSSVGRVLEKRTGLTRLDTDETVAAQFGMSITEIFETCGEQKFRDAEMETLRNISPKQPIIVVTGGGIVVRPGECRYFETTWHGGVAEGRRNDSFRARFAAKHPSIASKRESPRGCIQNYFTNAGRFTKRRQISKSTLHIWITTRSRTQF